MAYGALVAEDGQVVARATRIAALSLRLNDMVTALEWFERAAAASPKPSEARAAVAAMERSTSGD